MRAFISIDMPENVRKEIKLIQEHLPEFTGKLTENENLHLTLKFLGEISEQALKEIKEKLSKIRFSKLGLSLGEIGTFDYQGMPHIVWIKINHSESLQHKIDVALSDLFPREERFMSHLTIARVKFVSNLEKFKQAIQKINYEKMSFITSSFELKESKLSRAGPTYTSVESYKPKE